jgi:serine acetyltransferase
MINLRHFLNYCILRTQRVMRYLFFQRILGINNDVSWPVHFASRFLWPENIRFPDGMDTFNTVGMFADQYFQAYNGIVIHRGVRIGQGVKMISANHDMNDFRKHLPAPPIIIEKGCWIGVDAAILPGVHLGPFTTVGTGAVVTRSYPEGYLRLVGVPARPIYKSGQLSRNRYSEIYPSSKGRDR